MLLGATSIFGALELLYFDKTFGGVVDMVTAVTWGLGTGALAPSIAAAVAQVQVADNSILELREKYGPPA